MLTRIRNGYLADKKQIKIPFSNLKEEIAKVLEKEGYLKKIDVKKAKDKSYKVLTCYLKYKNNKPSITKIDRVSKPGRREYVTKENLPRVLNGLGIAVVSTSQGVMTGKEARKKGIGGELICQVW